jgi:hypothetical protein
VSQSHKLDGKDESVGTEGAYERPELTPIGNLHDLLAAVTGSQCDGTGPASGSDSTTCP